MLVFASVYTTMPGNAFLGLNEMMKELERDVSKVNISELCIRLPPSNDIRLLCFDSVPSLQEFAADFYVVSGQQHGNDLFLEIWDDHMRQASRGELKLDDIIHLVWRPCLQRCKELLESLKDFSMKLSDVDTLLKPHEEGLDTHLFLLLSGVNKVSKTSVTGPMINKAVAKVKQYWNLCQYRRGAETFLEVRDCLGLDKGDFSLVERLSQQVN